jgi:conjugative relaxase-like TrwC/TraI family protein
MLRITEQTVEANLRAYFCQALAMDDYLQQGAEEPGIWHGLGARLLGLEGRVEALPFAALLENRHPSKDERLTVRTKSHRRVGYDFTFLAPKSLAIVCELTGDRAILDAHDRAVMRTMDRIESDMKTRVRAGGQNHDHHTGNMIWATFRHHTARPVNGMSDMLLHTHAMAFNATHDAGEQRWKAGQFGEIKADGEFYAAVYHAELARELVSAGYAVRATKDAFEIEGVPEHTIRTFSRRTELIESIAQELGMESAIARANLGPKTRERKRNDVSLVELREEWSSRLTPHELEAIRSLKRPGSAVEDRPGPETSPGLGPGTDKLDAGPSGPGDAERARADPDDTIEEILERVGHAAGHGARIDESDLFERPGFFERARRFTAPVSLSANAAVSQAINELTHWDAVVHDGRILKRAQHLSMGRATMAQLEDALSKRSDLAGRRIDGKLFFTSTPALEQEERLVGRAQRTRNSHGNLGKVYLSQSYMSLDRRNRMVVDRLMGSRDLVTLFKQAGPTRKPEITRAALTGIQQGLGIPIVVATTANAARQAEADYGLKEVMTIHELLWRGREGDQLDTQLRQKVIWVEEAGRLGSRTTAELIDLAERAGCRVVLAGDETRCRVHERGDGFRLLREEAGLSTVERRVAVEMDDEHAGVLRALREESGPAAVQRLDHAGKLDLVDHDREVVRAASEYVVNHDQAKRRALVVTPDAARVEEYSQAVRALRRETGGLKGKDRTRLQLHPVYMSDKEAMRADSYERSMVVEFHRATRGFRPGDRAKVVAVAGGQVMVRSRYRVTTPVFLRISKPDNFSVYRPRTVKVAKGERIRITKNGVDPFGSKIRKGMTATVKEVCRVTGRLELDNGITLTKRFGHFEHDYAESTGGLGGRRVEHVAFAAKGDGWGQCDRVDLTAAADAAKRDFRIIVEDRQFLAAVFEHERPHHTATDLAKQPDLIRARELAAWQNAQERFELANQAIRRRHHG